MQWLWRNDRQEENKKGYRGDADGGHSNRCHRADASSCPGWRWYLKNFQYFTWAVDPTMESAALCISEQSPRRQQRAVFLIEECICRQHCAVNGIKNQKNNSLFVSPSICCPTNDFTIESKTLWFMQKYKWFSIKKQENLGLIWERFQVFLLIMTFTITIICRNENERRENCLNNQMKGASCIIQI